MNSLAADGASGAGTITILVLAVVVGYTLACAMWPLRACGRCGGAGRFRSPSGRAFRLCRRCKGSGRRTRLGRRAWTAVTELRHPRK